MLMVAAFALLAVCLAILFKKARDQRWFWAVAAVLVGSAGLFAVHARTTQNESTRLDASLSDSCRYLTAELHTIAFDFQSDAIATEKGVRSPVDVLRVRDQYSKIVNGHRDWVETCFPDARRCLPTELNEHTVDKIERATAVIDKGERCP